ncbi:MAG: hypothetical protein WA705_05335 [Candidatus Ozemobacteraceae bacterium]
MKHRIEFSTRELSDHTPFHWKADPVYDSINSALLQAVIDAKKDLSLADIAPQFQAFWNRQLSPEAYATMLLPPQMAWFRDFETMKNTGILPKNGNLMNFLNRRLNWEMTAEFRFSARIGRSLERQEAAVLFPDPVRMEKPRKN